MIKIWFWILVNSWRHRGQRIHAKPNTALCTIIVEWWWEDISKNDIELKRTSKIDTSWIKPVKYVGVWWEIHWFFWSYTNDYPSVQLGVTDYSKAKPNGTHGATTKMSRNILIRCWTWFWWCFSRMEWRMGRLVWSPKVLTSVTPYPDFDVKGTSVCKV
jgi:hypothetical protein